MQDFVLTLLFNIHGIGAASGLVFHDGNVLMIADDSNGLYQCSLADQTLEKIALQPSGITENIAKKDKPDYEAMAIADGKLYLFGSGSKKKRNALQVCDFPDFQHKSVVDLSGLYEKMRKVSGISKDDFNIEGALRYDGKWLLFQRGNGPGNHNGIFTISGNITETDGAVSYKAMPLPDCNGIPATFTDATLVGKEIYFTAAAENSNSVYKDGEIMGSMMGCIDPKKMELVFTKVISPTHKFEGLSLLEKSRKELTFLLCEDNDSGAQQTGLYKLVLRKK